MQIMANHLELQKQNLQLAEQLRNTAKTSCVMFDDVPHVAIQISGECEEMVGKVILETEEFAVFLNANDPTESIRSRDEYDIAAILASLILEAGGTISLDKMWDSISMVRADGKQIVPFNCSIDMEFADIDPLADDAPTRIIDRYHRLSRGNEKLGTVLRLLKLSLETEKDKLRSFLFGWSAIEIFINTVFKKYENEIFTEFSEGLQSELRVTYLKRIREVMKDKNRLTDKFSVIALRLCMKDADNDVKAFKKVKEVRNNLFHRSMADESKLSVTDIHALLVKYLQLHLGGNPRPATVRIQRMAGHYNPIDNPFGKST